MQETEEEVFFPAAVVRVVEDEEPVFRERHLFESEEEGSPALLSVLEVVGAAAFVREGVDLKATFEPAVSISETCLCCQSQCGARLQTMGQ